MSAALSRWAISAANCYGRLIVDREHEIARGDAAQGLLDSQPFMEVLDWLVEEQISHWRKSRPTDSAIRERTWDFVKVVDTIRDRLSNLAATAKSHRIQVEAENERRRKQNAIDEEIAQRLDVPVDVIRRERERTD